MKTKIVLLGLIVCLFSIDVHAQEGSWLGGFVSMGKTQNETSLTGVGATLKIQKSRVAVWSLARLNGWLEASTIGLDFENLEALDIGFDGDIAISNASFIGAGASYRKFPELDSMYKQWDMFLSYRGLLKGVQLKAGYAITPHQQNKSLDINAWRLRVGYEESSGPFQLNLALGTFFLSGKSPKLEGGFDISWRVFSQAFVKIGYEIVSVPQPDDIYHQFSLRKVDISFFMNL